MQKQNEAQETELRKIKVRNIVFPIIIGLGVVGYMIYNDYDAEAVRQLTFDGNSFFWLMIAILFMFGRDIGYIIRLKVLAGDKISWIEATRVIMLWEFTSAITPSAVGGTSFAIIYVHKAGISVGESSALVLLTSFLDELYFVIMFPVFYFTLGQKALFTIPNLSGGMGDTIFSFFIAGYLIKTIYTFFISYGLFIRPRGLKWIIVKVFSIKWLRKWRDAAVRSGDDIIVSSKELKRKGIIFWLKALGSTFLSWSSRYLVVNAILMAFFDSTDHFLLFARQFIMWVMMLVMPTPGGSGFSEFFFKEYLGEFFPAVGIAIIIALVWRLITYYPYLVIGVIVFPRWLRAKFPIRKHK